MLGRSVSQARLTKLCQKLVAVASLDACCSLISTCKLAFAHDCRTCNTDQQKVVRCHQILAASVNLHPSGHVHTTARKHETGLAEAVHAIRGTLSELCADGKDVATQALLLQPVASKLHTVAMLQYKRCSHNSDSELSIHELHQVGAEVAVLAAEVRFMLQRSCPADKQVALAVYDFQALTGEQSSCSLCVFMWCRQLHHRLLMCLITSVSVMQAGTLVQHWSCCWTMLSILLFPAKVFPSSGKFCTEQLCSCPFQVSSVP